MKMIHDRIKPSPNTKIVFFLRWKWSVTKSNRVPIQQSFSSRNENDQWPNQAESQYSDNSPPAMKMIRDQIKTSPDTAIILLPAEEKFHDWIMPSPITAIVLLPQWKWSVTKSLQVPIQWLFFSHNENDPWLNQAKSWYSDYCPPAIKMICNQIKPSPDTVIVFLPQWKWSVTKSSQVPIQRSFSSRNENDLWPNQAKSRYSDRSPPTIKMIRDQMKTSPDTAIILFPQS